tara:strand:- start:30 stop:347 length:318 start_codon:yes stop_codon:yes gene_type:complete
MANLANKIKLYLDREVDFQKDVKLQDDGQGAYIKEWNVDEAQPTDEQLNAFESEATTLESNNRVDATRRTAYGSWRDQLDEIYHDIDDWKARIKAVKDANAKETE